MPGLRRQIEFVRAMGLCVRGRFEKEGDITHVGNRSELQRLPIREIVGGLVQVAVTGNATEKANFGLRLNLYPQPGTHIWSPRARHDFTSLLAFSESYT